MKDILWRVYEGISEHRVLAIAAGTAFYVLLAIFPGIAALVALYGLFADPTAIGSHVDDVSGLAPGGALDILKDQIARVASQNSGTLGAAFVIGLGISIWSANAGMKALFDALNVVYGEKEKRSFVKLNLISLEFTAAGLVFILLAVTAVIVLPIALNYLGLESETEWLIRIVRWPVLLIVIDLAISLLYRYGPSRTEAKWQWISWGSAFATVVWLAASILFSWYAGNFGSYNKTYGSLGAVIGFMTWLWLSTIVVLVGAELDAAIERKQPREAPAGTPE